MQHFKENFILLLFFFISNNPCINAQEPPFLKYYGDAWADTIVSGLTLEEKIAQLVMLPANPGQGALHKQQLIQLIKKYRPGGIIIMHGSPVETAQLINDLQKASKIPLLIAIDGETGLGFRLDSTISYPYQQSLGAIQNDSVLYEMGRDIGKQFKEIGIHINFAPVADVNTNPDNPVINVRSLGEEKKNVALKAWQIAKGLQDEGITAVAKHFPGHGDTGNDSHYSLPVLNHTKKRLDSIEAYPFRFLINKGINGIMTAHLYVRAMDSTEIPSSLSGNVVNKYLRAELGFNGFVISDAMNMKAVTLPAGKAELEAIKAGNDMVELTPDIAKTISAIKKGVENQEIDESTINKKLRNVLALKRWAGLQEYQPVNIDGITSRLNNPVYEVTLRKLVEQSLTVIKNQGVLPVERLDTLKIASVGIGRDTPSSFQYMLAKYTLVDHFVLPKDATGSSIDGLLKKLRPYNLVICGIHAHSFPKGQYGISEAQVKAVQRIVAEKKTINVYFGNAYGLKNFKHIEHSEALVLAYQDRKLNQELAAQLIFGAIGSNGKLPVTVDNRFKAGDGIIVKKNGRLKYTIPEEVGISSACLSHQIDSIARSGIDSAAYPGCQVLIAKDGKVIFHKCYGFHTYKKQEVVMPEDIYDWASVTKITGPLPALMKLYDQGEFCIDAPIKRYWPDFIKSNKGDIHIRDILAHQGRLQAWIPFWMSACKKTGQLKPQIFKNHPSARYSYRVSSNLYMNNKYRKKIFKAIKDSPLLPTKEYLYSGLCFYLFPTIIENLTNTDYETYLKKNFFFPLGAYTITYNAFKHFPQKRIVPTEYDEVFRKELLRGFVHDEGAAMMGGVSGNAGLFGSANDLAKLMQMYLQYGSYGGTDYISSKTLKEFTRRQFPENDNRRGLGFDKPLIGSREKKLKEASHAPDASGNSFGHSGYTGTFTWDDPDNNLLYIFFSNRVFPTRENLKIYNQNIRPAIHQAIYDCIKKGLEP
ncbi:beta-glycosyl hydrolase / Uncharacterized esterase [hydrothermal vent metagenome]|uniref:beta-N-acetylhexosaminidase n=1 Tax=hydrothermal vent metagenome TaxID=652676 RepID=A0A3B0UW93_9ZZZZ